MTIVTSYIRAGSITKLQAFECRTTKLACIYCILGANLANVTRHQYRNVGVLTGAIYQLVAAIKER